MSEDYDTDGSFEETKNRTSVNRRRFVKSLGAGAAAFAGLSAAAGGAAASNTEYDGSATLESTLATHSGDLLSKLSDDGVLATADVSELDTRQVKPATVARNEEGTAVLTTDMNGIDEVSIYSVKRTDEGVLTVIVQPKSDDRNAVFSPDGTDETYLYSGQNLSDSPVTAQGSVGTDDAKVTPASTCTNDICNASATRTLRIDYLCAFGHCTRIPSCTCAA